MTDTEYWLWYRGIRAACGLYRQKMWKKGQRRWRALHPEPADGYTCALCGYLCRPTRFKRSREHPKAYDFTLDHIIPVAVILFSDVEYDIDLLWHPSNLQAAHMSCNGHKGESMELKTYHPPKHVHSAAELAMIRDPYLQSLVDKKNHVV